jgi:hypothetical protein
MSGVKKYLLEPALKIPRAVLRRGGAAGCVAPRLQISGEYAPSSRLAIHPAALAIPFPVYFQNRLLILAVGLVLAGGCTTSNRSSQPWDHPVAETHLGYGVPDEAGDAGDMP